MKYLLGLNIFQIMMFCLSDAMLFSKFLISFVCYPQVENGRHLRMLKNAKMSYVYVHFLAKWMFSFTKFDKIQKQ